MIDLAKEDKLKVSVLELIKVKAPSFKNFVDNKGLFDDEKTSSILLYYFY